MKIYNESGRLSDEGKKATKDFVAVIHNLLATGETPEDKRLIGSILTGMVGEITSNEATKK